MTPQPKTFERRVARRRQPPDFGRRGSFTLLELLVSLGIILILATLTMRLLNATLNSDRIRNGARELQSFLAGARDRAIYAGQPRGVRLIQDPLDRSTVHSFVYIGAPSQFTDGTQISLTTTGTVSTINFPNPQTANTWTLLVQRGLLTDGAYITLGGTLYSMARNPAGSATWSLTTTNYQGATNTPLAYTLQLLPSPLPGEEPRTLPQNIVIDLDTSVLPPTWGSPGAITGSLDVLFSPNGTVTGTVAAAGRIHFVLSEYVDASIPLPVAPAITSGVPLMDITSSWQANANYTAQTSWVVPNPQNDLAFQCITSGQSGGAQPAQFFTASPATQIVDGTVTWQCYNPKTRLIVSLATETGRVTTSPVNPLDKFRYAEIGEVTQ
jgi:type II secretory pathway pseudopilin PulG